MSPVAYDPDRPTESFKELLRDLLAGYEFDVKGLYLKDGSVEPLPAEPAVVGKVVEISIKHYLNRCRVRSYGVIQHFPSGPHRR